MVFHELFKNTIGRSLHEAYENKNGDDTNKEILPNYNVQDNGSLVEEPIAPPPSAYDSEADSATGRHTTKNILSDIFNGSQCGLKIPSALKDGNAIPWWGSARRSYPFVGINGYSNSSSIESQLGKETGFVKQRSAELETMFGSENVDSVINKQVTSGNGIPKSGFIFYYKNDISTVGSRLGTGGKAASSESVFNPKNVSTVIKRVGDYAIQQAFTVVHDVDGDTLKIDENGNGGIVLIPSVMSSEKASARTNRHVDNNIFRVIKMTDHHLGELVVKLGGAKYIAELITGASVGNDGTPIKGTVGGDLNKFFKNSRAVKDEITRHEKDAEIGKEMRKLGNKKTDEPVDNWTPPSPIENPIKNGGNPSFGKYDELVNSLIGGSRARIKYNGAIVNEFDDNNIDDDKYRSNIAYYVRYVILTKYANDIRGLCNDIVKPYLLMTPFENTYVVRGLTTDERSDESIQKAYEVYTLLRTSYGDNMKFDIAESVSSGSVVDTTFNGSALIEIFNGIVTGSNRHQTFVFTQNEQKVETKRDNENILVKHVGTKRMFIRICYGNLNKLPIDDVFSSRHGDLFQTSSSTLDYSKIFNDFPGVLDESMPHSFKTTRFCGYVVTFYNDDAIEDDFAAKHSDLGVDTENYALELLKAYTESANMNDLLIDEPIVFDVVYFHPCKYNDMGFISSGYEQITDKYDTSTMLTPCPYDVSTGGALNGGQLYSTVYRSYKNIIVSTAYNTKLKTGII